MAQPTDTIPRSGIPLQNSALSLLKGSKARNGPTPFPGITRQPSGSQTPSRLALRTPSRSIKPAVSPSVSSANSTPTIPTLRSISNSTAHPEFDAGNKEVRKSISIASFPQPPGVSWKIPATPKTSSSVPHAMAESIPIRSSSNKATMQSVGGSRLKRLRISEDPPNNTHATSTALPILQNSNGSGKPAITESNPQLTNGPPSGQSPPISRSSSAQDSCSTSATTFEDMDETSRRGRNDQESVPNRPAKENKGNVIVSVRVRPDASGNGDKKSEGEWMVDGRRSLVAYKGREGGEYFYDNVFATHDKNHKIYDASAKRLVRRVMEGYHGTVFAYGMTGTGKTFSMQGTATSPGVIPLAITDIFSYIRETPHREFLLRVSYLEIYNEKIHDLLLPPTASGIGPGSTQPEEIKLREDSKRGVYASPLKEEIVQSPTQLLRVIARGDHSRRTRSTQYNAQSSRSHAVVQIVVESRERAQAAGTTTENKRAALVPGGVRVSTLSMIDLAGSERAAENKERRTEGSHINKSLLTLGTVIARLSGEKDSNGNATDKDGKHLPYRDSKLTRLLQPALSGNSLVSILCTIQIGSAGSVAHAGGHTGETLNTLKFAARAKTTSKVLLERYRMEILNLRSQLEAQGKSTIDKDDKHLEKQAQQRHEEQMLEMQLARTALKERIEHLNRLILSSKSTGVNSKGQFSSLGRPPRLDTSNNRDTSKILRSPNSACSPNGNQADQSPSSSFEHEGDEDDSLGEFGDGTATSKAHIRALQADLADKNRYISTLEKRLLQARRSSQTRTSLAFTSSALSPSGLGDEQGVWQQLQERDAEVADLRAQLDDKDRMVNALRSAARKRDIADFGSEPVSPEAGKESQHRVNPSNESYGSSGAFPFSPVELLSPQKEKETKRKSIDEMSKILDEMIQDRVESGQLVKSNKGSVRATHERSNGSLSTVPKVGALAASLRPTSTISEAEAPAS
ncbi:kinesin-related protein 11 [Physcia stellaris]|nr:kinesin-related protein 11 [Physcia stellaris]